MVGIHCVLSDKMVEGKCQIYVRATITRTYRPMLKTDIYVLPRFFKGGTIVVTSVGRISEKNKEELKEAKRKLDIYCEYLESLVHTYPEKVLDKAWLRSEMLRCRRSLDIVQSNDAAVDITQVKAAIDSGEAEKALYEYIDAYVISKRLSNGRTEKYKNMKRLLMSFELFEKYMGNESFRLIPSALNAEVLTAFQDYCMNRGVLAETYPGIFDVVNKSVAEKVPYQKTAYTPNNSSLSQNTCISNMVDLRSIVNWLISKSVIANDPFANVTIKECAYPTRPVFITIDERKQLAALDLHQKPNLEVQRDIFIFHCLVGCRFGDLIKLTEENVVEGRFLQYVPSKTKNLVNSITPKVPLTEEAKSLIEKYRGRDENGRLFPFTSNAHYNDCLKTIFTLAGLTRTVQVLNPQTRMPESIPLNEFVSSHLARRTFIGNLYNKIKDPGIISVMSGHVEHSRAFSRYRDIGDDVRRELIDKIK